MRQVCAVCEERFPQRPAHLFCPSPCLHRSAGSAQGPRLSYLHSLLLVSGGRRRGRPPRVPGMPCASHHRFVWPCAVELSAFSIDGAESNPHTFKFGWILNFLTLWNLLTQSLYMTFSAVTAFCVWRDLGATTKRSAVLGAGDSSLQALRAPWGDQDPEEAARPVTGYCAQCLSASGNSQTDFGWQRFADKHLSDSTKTLLQHRDRWFHLVLVSGTIVGIGFWCVLFPHPAVRGRYFKPGSVFLTVRTVLDHGFTTAAIWSDALLVRHRGDARALWGYLLTTTYGVAYCVWNVLICAPINHRFAYPSVQVGISKLHPAIQFLLYAGVAGLFPALYTVFRMALTRYWRRGGGHQASGGGGLEFEPVSSALPSTASAPQQLAKTRLLF